MLEVTGAGVPVIATDVGGVSEIIQNKKTGILIPPMKPAMLAEAIRHGLREKAVMERCAQKAKEATAAYTKERMIKKTTELYRSLLLSRESNR
jgi:glycosyltransferase involved in cell wall biosynthesis